MISALGFFAAVLTTVCWFPQAWRTIRSGDTRAISLAAQAMFALGLAAWAAYGAAIGSLPLLLANVITLGPVLVILALKLRHLRADRVA